MLTVFYRADGDSRLLRKVGTCLPNSTASNFIILRAIKVMFLKVKLPLLWL